MQGVVAGVWDVKHQRGHVEGRKADAREWTDGEWGKVEADRVCGRTRKMALKDELEWLGKVDGWSAKHRELEKKYDIIPERLVYRRLNYQLGSMLCRRWSRGSYLLVLTCSGNCVGIIRLWLVTTI
jgi:hypothetical protein